MANRLTKKVLLVGWDAADWRVISPLLDAGHMPALEQLIDRGVMGNLATLTPPLSPLLWTSVATGVTADRHGVLGFTQPRADGSGIRPVLGTSRRVKALWNMLHQSGMRSNVIGWWPSHPAEPIRGVMVSNFHHQMGGGASAVRPPQPGAVHPPEAASELAELRVHPSELTASHILPFVPFYTRRGTDDIEPYEQNALDSIARTVAEAASVQAATTWAMAQGDWDLTAVYFDAIDHVGHNFMKYHPPRMSGVGEDRFERFRHVVTATYRYQDMMLERLVDLAGDDTTVIVISDHGFHADHLRAKHRVNEPAGPAAEHRGFGIFCAAGPGIRSDERIYGASLLDVTPTILTLLGLPVGRDMDGRVLHSAFDQQVDVEYVPSWEDLQGEAGQHSGDVAEAPNPWGDQVALEQLVALGYVEAPDESGEASVRLSRYESRHYLAQVYLGKSQPDLALPLLEELWEEEPARRVGLHLVSTLQALRRFAEAHAVLDQIVDRRLFEFYRDKAQSGASLPEDAVPIFPGLDLKRGGILIAEERYEDALPLLQRAESVNPRSPSMPRQIGEAYLMIGRAAEAETAFRRSLALEPEQPRTLLGLARAHTAQQNHGDAAAAAMQAVGLRFFYPAAHAALGDALVALGQVDRAAQAYEVALVQRPAFTKARFALADAYAQLGRDVDRGRLLAGAAPRETSGPATVSQRREDREK